MYAASQHNTKYFISYFSCCLHIKCNIYSCWFQSAVFACPVVFLHLQTVVAVLSIIQSSLYRVCCSCFVLWLLYSRHKCVNEPLSWRGTQNGSSGKQTQNYHDCCGPTGWSWGWSQITPRTATTAKQSECMPDIKAGTDCWKWANWLNKMLGDVFFFLSTVISKSHQIFEKNKNKIWFRTRFERLENLLNVDACQR